MIFIKIETEIETEIENEIDIKIIKCKLKVQCIP
jgi:hypothetical protein